MPGRHIWHPSVLPEPASNMHARPFKSITRAMGDIFILADVSVRRRFDSPKQRRRGGKTNGTCRARGSRCRRDISRSGAEGKAACWSERGLKIARDRTKTAQLLKRACTEHVNAKHLNPKTRVPAPRLAHARLNRRNATLESEPAARRTAAAEKDWLQSIMSPQEVFVWPWKANWSIRRARFG